MAERKAPSRRLQNSKQDSTRRQATSRRSTTEKQTPSRRNDVIRCENCGEDYSVTYKRCPFCDERPGRSGISGRRVAGGGYGPAVHPVQVIGLVISLVLIIAALFIVFKYVGPLIFNNEDAVGSGSSMDSSQTDSSNTSQIPSGDSSADGSGTQTGDGSSTSSSGGTSQSELPQTTVQSLTLSRTEFTLQPSEQYQVTATVAPSGTKVTWSSSDSSIMTVDEDGIVKNVNTSSELVKATLTATAGDKSAECVVFCKGSGTGGSTSGSSGSSSGSTSGNSGSSGGTSSTGPVAANTPGTISNAGNGLNVRSGPGSSYEKVASIKNGDKIIILEDTGSGWYKIDYGGGGVGYVSSDYVTVGG